MQQPQFLRHVHQGQCVWLVHGQVRVPACFSLQIHLRFASVCAVLCGSAHCLWDCALCLSIGNSDPGSCVERTAKCDTILETAKCPDCHLPWIRFANAVPSSNTLDCKITQGTTTKTWSSYKFAQFSDWSQTFKVGPSQIEISSGGKTLLTVTMPLTPGPLVVVVKDDWPPTKQSAIETIAASYNPVPKGQAGVRLFNLAPDKTSAQCMYCVPGRVHVLRRDEHRN